MQVGISSPSGSPTNSQFVLRELGAGELSLQLPIDIDDNHPGSLGRHGHEERQVRTPREVADAIATILTHAREHTGSVLLVVHDARAGFGAGSTSMFVLPFDHIPTFRIDLGAD
jgi:hypothetical protein